MSAYAVVDAEVLDSHDLHIEFDPPRPLLGSGEALVSGASHIHRIAELMMYAGFHCEPGDRIRITFTKLP